MSMGQIAIGLTDRCGDVDRFAVAVDSRQDDGDITRVIRSNALAPSPRNIDEIKYYYY